MGSGEYARDAAGDVEQHAQRSVLVQVRASATDLPPLRVVAADLAARADFDLDAVADLRLAVDEAASELVAVAAPDAVLTCVFSLNPAQMEVTSSVPAKPGATLRRDSFGWRVLTTLVDEVTVVDEPGADPPLVGISLCKRRSVNALAEGR
ncbi:MAG TPA: ATP-binding protein [Pseudonocardiaceae bacterium]|jgi:serine/threonine-protein kinase RsbW